MLLLGIGVLSWSALLAAGSMLLENPALSGAQRQAARWAALRAGLLGGGQVLAALAMLRGARGAVWAGLFIGIAHGSIVAGQWWQIVRAQPAASLPSLLRLLLLATVVALMVALWRALAVEGGS